jgi:NDP-sugar pyrophosphorylase family protein
MFKHAVIISGGNGTRMLPLTEYIPKALVKTNNKKLIDYAVDFFKLNDIENIHITYGYKCDQLINHIHTKSSSLLNTINQDNSYFVFNTIIKYINEPIIVCPCDLDFDINLNELYAEYVNLKSPAACIIPIEYNSDADKIQQEDQNVLQINKNVKSNLSASGIQIINPFKINQLITPHQNFYDVWKELIKQKQLLVTRTKPTKWKCFDKISDLT